MVWDIAIFGVVAGDGGPPFPSRLGGQRFASAFDLARLKPLDQVPGVANAEVSDEKHTATVVFDDQKTTVAALISATTNAGYARKPHHESV